MVFLDGYDGDDKYIAFRLGSEDAGSWSRVFIDDVLIEVIPDCLEPYNLQADDVGLSSAILSWTEPGISEEWDIIYGMYGFDPDTGGTMVNVTDNPWTLENINHARDVSRVTMTNVAGQQVIDVLLTGSDVETIDTGKLVKGVYLLTVYGTNGDIHTRRMIKAGE